MEGVREGRDMRTLLLLMGIMVLVVGTQVGATEKFVGVYYYKNIFGHIHQNPSTYSTSLATIECGHPVRIFDKEHSSVRDWYFVQVASYKGYIRKEYLDIKKPECFQSRFPKFFDGLELDLTEMYFWGRLYDQYVMGRSKVR